MVRRLSNAAIVLSATALLVALVPFLEETYRTGAVGAVPPSVRSVTAPTTRQPVVFWEPASSWIRQTTCVGGGQQGQHVSGYGVVVGLSGNAVHVAPRAYANVAHYGDVERTLVVDPETTPITLADGSGRRGSAGILRAGDAIYYTGTAADPCAGRVMALQIVQTLQTAGVPRSR